MASPREPVKHTGDVDPRQLKCQATRHDWDHIPRPQGYETMWFLTVFFRCTCCTANRVTHVDQLGHCNHDYKYPHWWVKYRSNGTPAPTPGEKKLQYYTSLDESLVARGPTNPRSRRRR